jgi:membrane protease YdiL (CAAX protease family)
MIWIYAAVLIGWGNVVNYFVSPMLPGGDWAAVAWGVSLVVVSLLFARLLRERPSTFGLARGDLRGIALGAALGLGGAAVGVLVLRIGPILGPVTYTPLFDTTPQELAAHIVFFLPISTAIPEELAFRGVLLGGLWKARGPRVAIVGSSVAFALWHLWVVSVTLVHTNIASGVLTVLAFAGAIAFVALGGVVLSLLRLRSGGLGASIVAHWAFDGLMLLGLWI